MRLVITFSLAALISVSSFAQKLEFTITGVSDTTINLVKYVGNKLYYADTVDIVNGHVIFDGSRQEPGILAVLLPEQKYFEFIYDNEDVKIETTSPNFIETMKVIKSEQNKKFLKYIKRMKSSRLEADALQNRIKELDETDTVQKELLKKQIKDIGLEIVQFQKELAADNPNTLVSKVIKMSTEIEEVEAPKDESGNKIDEYFAYHHFRDHFFDNIDLSDSRLVNTPILQNKVEQYISDKVLVQQPDSLIKYIKPVMDRLPEGTMMYRFFATTITSHFEKSKIMGLDKVANFMLNEYFCKKGKDGNYKAYWMDDERLDEVCERASIRKHLMVGEIPPNLILPDSTNQKWVNLHKLEADYTILYFWDPNCGHCKKITPKLEQLYAEKMKDRNVKVVAVGKASGDSWEDWKKFIRTKNLTFINIGVTEQLYKQAKENPYSVIPSKTTLESINYQKTYDIYSTPTLFLLDKDKKIIAKSLSMGQLEDLLDRLQEKEGSEKIFEPDEPDE